MKKTVILISFALIFSACASQSFRSEFDFANSLARKGLWKEARYRWEKAIRSGDNSAAAHNNIAISYEFQGELELAMREYQKALKILPGNSLILQNIRRLRIRMGLIKGNGNPDHKKEYRKKKNKRQGRRK